MDYDGAKDAKRLKLGLTTLSTLLTRSGHLSAAADLEMADFASPLLNLPDEVLVLVVSELPPTDLKSLARCSRKAMRIADDSSIWRRAVERYAHLYAVRRGFVRII